MWNQLESVAGTGNPRVWSKPCRKRVNYPVKYSTCEQYFCSPVKLAGRTADFQGAIVVNGDSLGCQLGQADGGVENQTAAVLNGDISQPRTLHVQKYRSHNFKIFVVLNL